MHQMTSTHLKWYVIKGVVIPQKWGIFSLQLKGFNQ